ncbi:uncharacterized protein LOC107981799 [Nasonia vitripennis]|uniref:DDE Tnp4 domain-containing protein n=1 Tax=Nasonia vitripennis TaxID=7425 RepID=A0A7M7J751_NASVI|nr:uncharacterized protein LOC107981799 [Nasonia vitripennis]
MTEPWSVERLYLRQLLQNSEIPLPDITRRIKRFQIHEINCGRKYFGEYHHLFPILKMYPDKFKEYTRMKPSTFEYLLLHIKPTLTKNWCNLHTQPILEEERLVLTLRFLATGSSYTHLAFSFRMGVSTVCTVIEETMTVIWNKLQPIHMPIPTAYDFGKIADRFYNKWDFPHCVGAIDGRHIRIKKPANSGSLYYNYKKFFSIVLQAAVDADYRFITIDVGGYGHQSEGGTFKESKLYKALAKKILKIPEEDELPNSNTILPYCFVC